jgi:cation:H+ antiporter
MALLILGARLLVTGAVAIATAWGVSDLVIGLTIVAAGTSLPELATSVVAVLRNERDIAIGNVVGSNLYNLLAILGLSALAAPGGLEINPTIIRVDLPVMIGSAFACLPFFFTGHTLARWEGVSFLGYYAAYLAYLVLAALAHPSLAVFNAVMLAFVLPLTIFVIAGATWRDWRRRREPSTGSH